MVYIRLDRSYAVGIHGRKITLSVVYRNSMGSAEAFARTGTGAWVRMPSAKDLMFVVLTIITSGLRKKS